MTYRPQNKIQLAAMLGVTRQTLEYRIKKGHIAQPDIGSAFSAPLVKEIARRWRKYDSARLGSRPGPKKQAE